MPETKNKPNQSSGNSIGRSAGVVSIAIMTSRLLGLVREKVIAQFFSAAVGADAFTAAFRIPNLIRELFAEGALSKAFIATFTDTEAKEGPEAAEVLANRIFVLAALVLSIITAIGIYATPFIVRTMLPGEGFALSLDPLGHVGFTTKGELTIFLARIMFPFLMLVSFAAIVMGILNTKKIFGVPALASAFFNIGAIAGGIAGYYWGPGVNLHPSTGLAAGVLAGGFMQFAVQLPSLWKTGFRFRFSFSLRSKRVQQVMLLMGPAILGASVFQLSIFINSIFASEGAGWITWLSRSFRLMHLPLGIFGVAISTVALPNFARFVSSDDPDGFRDSLQRALRLSFFLTVPATIVLMILAEPICRIIFEGGKTGPVDTVQTANALFFMSLAIAGYSATKITTDGFYAYKDTRTPMFISIFTVGLNILLNYVFVYHIFHTHWSLALSTGITQNLNFLLLIFFLRRKVGGLNGKALFRFIPGLVLSSAVFGWLIYTLNWVFDIYLDTENLFMELVKLVLTLGIGGGVFMLSSYLLKLDEAIRILGVLRRRSH
ncbi:MAG: murein biosynthesis integral membrane protein MurJ [Calditrichaeota bacterium]|nr:MAG: murein biosynthesis integral membrane protein MurJ [Calditrichota bacterium]